MFDEKATLSFLRKYGNRSFEEFPFCDGDAFLFSEIFYMPFEKVVSPSFDVEPVSYRDAVTDLFELRNNKHTGNGMIMFMQMPSRNMYSMAFMKRWAGMKIAAVRFELCKSPALSFCAATFILPDGKLLVNYRGTDDTVAGWKEDFDIILTKGTPSHPIATEYLDKVAETFEGDIIITGHSKGGNLGLYAAMNCKPETRKRITALYNNDGPGFYDHSFIDSPEFAELQPVYHHFITKSDVIGVCMAHDYNYKVVSTFFHFPMCQHYIGNWQIQDGNAITIPEPSKITKTFDVWNANLLSKITASEKYNNAVEEVFDRVSVDVGYDTLTDSILHMVGTLKNGAASWKRISADTRSSFTEAFKGSLKSMVDIAKNIDNLDPETCTKEAFKK